MLAIARRRAQTKSRRGLTLLELLLAIAGGVVLTITAVMLFMQVGGTTKVQEAFQQVQSITSGVKSLYSGASSYDTVDITKTAISAKVFQNKYVTSDTTAVNPWGGAVTIMGVTRTFTISYAAVPEDACTQLVAMNSSGFGGSVRRSRSTARPSIRRTSRRPTPRWPATRMGLASRSSGRSANRFFGWQSLDRTPITPSASGFYYLRPRH